MKRYLRIEGLVALALLALMALIYSQVFLEYHVKYLLETNLAQLNGAKISIRDLEIRWLRRTATLRGIELGSAVSPMKNTLELDEVTLGFQLQPILRKKLIIEHLAATGVHVGTIRNTSAYLQYDPTSQSIPIAIFDRAAEGRYNGVRATLAQNPLRFLGYLAGGVDIHSKLEMLHSQLKTVNELKNAIGALSSLQDQWQSQLKTVPTVPELTALIDEAKRINRMPASLASDSLKELRTSIAKKKSTLENTELIEKNYLGIKQKLQTLENLVQEDVGFVRERLNLPRLDSPDFSFHVFGGILLQLCERVAYWIDLSRRYMPVNPPDSSRAFTLQGDGVQTRVHFGSRMGTPSILIKKAVISSASMGDVTLGDVNAIIEGLTIDPGMLGTPMTIALQADFPHHNFRQLTLNATVDHTGAVPYEKVTAKIDTLPLNDTTLHSSQDLRLAIERAKASVEFETESKGDSLLYQWNARLTETDFSVTSRYKLAEEAMQALLRDMYAFQVTGEGKGSQDEIELKVQSEIGSHLAEGLRHNFRYQLAAIDDNLRLNIRDQVISERLRLEEKLQEFERHTLVQYHRVRDLLSNLQALSEG